MLSDFHQQDRHAGLKRWERGAQRAAWAQRATESVAPPLPCPWRARPSDPLTLRPARLLALFSGDLAVVRFLHRPDGSPLASPRSAPGTPSAAGYTAPEAAPKEREGRDACPHHTAEPAPAYEEGIRVLRGGFPWTLWAPVILTAWSHAAPVPDPFRLRRRLPPQWLERARAASAADQAAFLLKLRDSGLLAPLQTVTPEAVASWLRWDEMRARLIDAKGEGDGAA